MGKMSFHESSSFPPWLLFHFVKHIQLMLLALQICQYLVSFLLSLSITTAEMATATACLTHRAKVERAVQESTYRFTLSFITWSAMNARSFLTSRMAAFISRLYWLFSFCFSLASLPFTFFLPSSKLRYTGHVEVNCGSITYHSSSSDVITTQAPQSGREKHEH